MWARPKTRKLDTLPRAMEDRRRLSSGAYVVSVRRACALVKNYTYSGPKIVTYTALTTKKVCIIQIGGVEGYPNTRTHIHII